MGVLLAAARVPRRKLVAIVDRFFLANLLVFFALLQLWFQREWVARAFFVWTTVFNLFVVSVFWSVVSDVFRPEQGRRLFGCVAAGAATRNTRNGSGGVTMSITRRRFLHATAAAGALPLLTRCAGAMGAGAGADAKGGKKLRLLILGGTKYLGPELVNEAQARGHVLTLFNRGKTNPQLFPDLEKLHGDRNGDLKSLEGRSWDAVLDTSGYVPKQVAASAGLLSKRVAQYVFISTISVYPDGMKPGSDETAAVQTVPDPTSEDVQKHYGGLKALCEAAAEAAMPGRVTNVRPGLIVGPGDPTDRFTYWPVRISRGGDVLAPGSGEDPAQLIDVRDLASWVITAVERKHVGVFNALGPAKKMTMREMLEGCRRGVGSDARLVWADAKVLEKNEVSPWMDMPVWTGGDAGFASISNARAVAAGMTFRPIDATAKDTLAWFKTQPPERRAKLRAGVTPEREEKVLQALRAPAQAAG
ncbi:MAG TPA: NAD-dependent epimerase/dehydratase family protein [Myxococcaceae bacterium]|nr:NAD-dependent epimerase/dehydratase family protein [Myxococcaceae bacterium]